MCLSAWLPACKITKAICKVLRVRECSFESWVGQASKIAFAGYVVEQAGGPKEAYFDKPSQEKLHDMQQARSARTAGLLTIAAC